jgi:hypothetical protein
VIVPERKRGSFLAFVSGPIVDAGRARALDRIAALSMIDQPEEEGIAGNRFDARETRRPHGRGIDPLASFRSLGSD